MGSCPFCHSTDIGDFVPDVNSKPERQGCDRMCLDCGKTWKAGGK